MRPNDDRDAEAPADPPPAGGLAAWCPAADVVVTDDAVIVRVELAGVRPRDVRVSTDGLELVVAGVRRDPLGPRPRRIDRMEISFGPFERVVPLPTSVSADAASAELSQGLLEVVLPLAAMPSRVVAVSVFVLGETP